VLTNERDPEIAACEALIELLSPLDSMTRARVLDWAKERFLPHGSDPQKRAQFYLDTLVKQLDEVYEHKRSTKEPTDADKRLWASATGA
jgi:hypothetical protein